LEHEKTASLETLVIAACISADGSRMPSRPVGVSYQLQLFADGSVRPYSWSVVAGQLPPGLSLRRSGLISGLPAAAGTFAFTARATDQAGAQAARQFSIVVTG
jgi:hypothetical protein